MIFHRKKCLKDKKYIIVMGSECQVATRAPSLQYAFFTSAYFQQYVVFLYVVLLSFASLPQKRTKGLRQSKGKKSTSGAGGCEHQALSCDSHDPQAELCKQTWRGSLPGENRLREGINKSTNNLPSLGGSCRTELLEDACIKLSVASFQCDAWKGEWLAFLYCCCASE